jgi:hypothetical protein
MQRLIGTHARAVRAPIISQGDNLESITVDCILDAAKSDGFEIKDRIDISEIAEETTTRYRSNGRALKQSCIKDDVASYALFKNCI